MACLLLDKAAYASKELVLKSISRDVINRVEISPSPFPIAMNPGRGNQTTDSTIFMVCVLKAI